MQTSLDTAEVTGLRAELGATTTLKVFLDTAGELTTANRLRIVEQARVLIEQTYVHLPLKQAMHAVDPAQRLRLLERRLPALTERQFHDEMISIFTELRDLHTNYILPAPFQGKTAFLPFLVEEFFEGGEPRFMVSKVFAGFNHPTFAPGARIQHWNGIPIGRAVELNADRFAGSNEDARHARGLEALTIRPMGLSAPPDEGWVVVGYTAGGVAREIRIDWLVFSPDPSPSGVDPNSGDDPAAWALGIDALTEETRRAKKRLFNPRAMTIEHDMEALSAKALLAGDATPDGDLDGADLANVSTMPDVFSFRTAVTPHGSYGVIRIWTFNVNNADAFVNEFVRIAGLLPQNGLIVDVRGNGGGLITAGERLLQVLTPKTIEPERLHFINRPLTRELCETHSFIGQWAASIGQAVETGELFSQGFPIDPPEAVNRLGQRYHGPVVLITDALCYSTTDIFAAGFQDHSIGTILGTSGNTGAGGANVWTHQLLRQLLPGSSSPFKALPKSASFRVAIRRNTRVGPRSGVPLEDLGVIPDETHKMTENDHLNDNADLIGRAAQILANQPVRTLRVSAASVSGGNVQATVTTGNIDRVDAYVNERPRATFDVSDGNHALTVPAPGGGSRLDLRGFAGGEMVAVARRPL